MSRVKFTTTLDSDLVKATRIYGIENGRGANDLIEQALYLYMALIQNKPIEEVRDLFPTCSRLRLVKKTGASHE